MIAGRGGGLSAAIPFALGRGLDGLAFQQAHARSGATDTAQGDAESEYAGESELEQEGNGVGGHEALQWTAGCDRSRDVMGYGREA